MVSFCYIIVNTMRKGDEYNNNNNNNVCSMRHYIYYRETKKDTAPQGPKAVSARPSGTNRKLDEVERRRTGDGKRTV